VFCIFDAVSYRPNGWFVFFVAAPLIGPFKFLRVWSSRVSIPSIIHVLLSLFHNIHASLLTLQFGLISFSYLVTHHPRVGSRLLGYVPSIHPFTPEPLGTFRSFPVPLLLPSLTFRFSGTSFLLWCLLFDPLMCSMVFVGLS